MEGIREIAAAYHRRSPNNDQEAAMASFHSLGADHYNLLSLDKFINNYSKTPWIFNLKVFRELDVDGDGALSFEEFLPAYYIMNKLNLVACSGCRTLLAGPYFSCRLCLGKSGDGGGSFHLCCSCYVGNVNHEHSVDNLVDHHSLLAELRQHYSVMEISPKKKNMEELREIAMAHYNAGWPDVQQKARDFFNSMDTDRNSRVNLIEFMEFMKRQEYSPLNSPNFFLELDLDGNKTLDFTEVMMLYYIIKSKRPFCSNCHHIIGGTFFSCIECFKTPHAASFTLCHNCYCLRNCNHNHCHNGRATVLVDNYMLLEIMRSDKISPTNPNTSIVPQPHIHYNAYYIAQNYHPHPVPNQMNENALANTSRNRRWDLFFALETALSIGAISASLCTIL